MGHADNNACDCGLLDLPFQNAQRNSAKVPPSGPIIYKTKLPEMYWGSNNRPSECRTCKPCILPQIACRGLNVSGETPRVPHLKLSPVVACIVSDLTCPRTSLKNSNMPGFTMSFMMNILSCTLLGVEVFDSST